MSHPTVITNDNIHELVLQYMNNDPDFPDGLEEIRNWETTTTTTTCNQAQPCCIQCSVPAIKVKESV